MRAFPVLPTGVLARSALLRQPTVGDDTPVSALWEEPGCFAVAAHRSEILVSGSSLRRLDRSEAPDGGIEIALGRTPEGHPVIGLVMDPVSRMAVDALPGETSWRSLRDIGLGLDDLEASIATPLLALSNWHETHVFSPRTGRPTVVSGRGWMRLDPEDGTEFFPRTEPAVITAILHTPADGVERMLLARNALWEERRYSLVAGFVEAGEGLEAAVRREVAEEVGLTLDLVHYAGSQPWPFPASLMLGFYATVADADFAVDGEEILSARWLSRDQMREQSESGEILLPSHVSIAGGLLHAWLNGGSTA